MESTSSEISTQSRYASYLVAQLRAVADLESEQFINVNKSDALDAPTVRMRTYPPTIHSNVRPIYRRHRVSAKSTM